VNAALSDHAYRAQLQIPEGPGGPILEWASIAKDFNALRKSHPEIVRITTLDVEVTTLDALISRLGLAPVTGLKIDAEGAEYEVLRGGRQLLREMRPILSMELEERHRSGCTFSVPAFLDALGYSCFFQIGNEILPFPRFDRGLMQRSSPSPLSHDYSDPYVNCFYFLPVEQEAEFLARWQANAVQ
jgi:FkbM family methyltransferase